MSWDKSAAKLLQGMDGGNVIGFELTEEWHKKAIEERNTNIRERFPTAKFDPNGPLTYRGKPVDIGKENRPIIQPVV